MKKIINNAVYNTDTAKRIGEWDNKTLPNDLLYCAETLYKTKAGKYFLHGEGGAMSKYAVSVGNNSWTGGEHIEPLTPQTAQEWAEERLTAAEYAAEFDEPAEADDKVSLNLNIPASTKAKLEKMRTESGKSISALITEMVEKA